MSNPPKIKIQSASSVPGKETIYVDVDDEITAIIEKVRLAKGKVIALVLPKRAAVLQSVVNMKLLKHTADKADKNLVLITTEAGLMPLAGSVGLHVASTPTSKPSIPPAPVGPSDEPESVDEPLDIVDGTADADYDPSKAADKTVGELAGGAALGGIAASSIDEDIEMGDEDEPTLAADSTKVSKPKKNKKLIVPNFDTFKKKLLLVGLVAVLLIVGGIFAFVVLPKAAITIKTDSSTIKTNLNLALDTTAKSVDSTNSIVPAVAQSNQKTSTQQATATGQQNNGQQASGQIKIINCSGAAVTLPVGASFSSSGYTFIGQNSVTVPDSNYSKTGTCHNDGTGTVNVTALHGGAGYNLAPASYAISNNPGGLTATGSQMSGGTDNITKIVAQTDIDGATAKIKAIDTTSIKQQLISDLQAKGLQPVPTTFLASAPQITSSAQAGTAADTVTVTGVTTYTMLGVKTADLKTLVDANVTMQLEKGRQVILDDGVANAIFSEQNPATATSASVSMTTQSVAGPQLDVAAIKKEIVGMKAGDIQALIKQTPGVTDVNVKLSPFWVSSVPSNSKKVTVQIDKSGAQ